MDKKAELILNHKLELRRIVIEKAFFGIVLVLGAFLANLVLETYKSNAVIERFLIEKRVESAREVLSANSNTTSKIYVLLEKELWSRVVSEKNSTPHPCFSQLPRFHL